MVVVLENGDTGIDSNVAASAVRRSRIVQRGFATRGTGGHRCQGDGRRKESREHTRFSCQPPGAGKRHPEPYRRTVNFQRPRRVRYRVSLIRTETSLEAMVPTAKSCTPSPLRSPTAMDQGLLPSTGNLCVSRKDTSCAWAATATSAVNAGWQRTAHSS